MTTTTIRISSETRNLLGELALAAGVSMQKIIERALENYRRQLLLAASNAAYAALRADPRAWQQFGAEQEAWDTTLADGLEEV